MPFTYPWNESEPNDNTPVREGDDWIRRNALNVRERLAVEHYAYANEAGATNVGYHKPGSAKVLWGLEAARPTPRADAPGTLYLAIDTGKLYYDNGTAWTVLGHAAQHKTGGGDALVPADIGAVAQTTFDEHAANASAHHTRYTDAEAWNAVLARDGAGSGLDADRVDGEDAATLKANARLLNAEFRVETRTSDPTSPAVGRMWLRTDL